MCAKHTHAELCAHAQAADLCTQGSRTPCQAGWVEERWEQKQSVALEPEWVKHCP